jgi:hypothetical protein
MRRIAIKFGHKGFYRVAPWLRRTWFKKPIVKTPRPPPQNKPPFSYVCGLCHAQGRKFCNCFKESDSYRNIVNLLHKMELTHSRDFDRLKLQIDRLERRADGLTSGLMNLCMTMSRRISRLELEVDRAKYVPEEKKE